MLFRSRHILFIVSGAFDRLAERVRKRLDQAAIGFQAAAARAGEPDLSAYLQRTNTRDFIDYGFEPEFVGRLPVRVACEQLKAEDLAVILASSEGSLLRQYERDFDGYGIELKVTPEAIDAIAARAADEGTGARGLMTVLESALRDFKFELPSTGIKTLEITTETIADPRTELTRILTENEHLMEDVWQAELAAFTDNFERRHGYRLACTPEATKVLIEAATASDRTLRTVCEERFKDYPHGLSILQNRTGATTFEITEAAARDPDGELSKQIVAAFRQTDSA